MPSFLWNLEATTTRQTAASLPGEANFLASSIFNVLLSRVKVSRAPELTDVSEKSDDVRLVSSPGVFLKSYSCS